VKTIFNCTYRYKTSLDMYQSVTTQKAPPERGLCIWMGTEPIL